MLTSLEEGNNIPFDPRAQRAQQMSVNGHPEKSTTDAEWEPVGDEDALRWKRSRSEPADSARHDQEADREVPFNKIPKHQIAEYAVSEAKEWDTRLETEGVTVLSSFETEKIRDTTSRSRITRLRYVNQDKTRTYGHHKPVYP